MFNMLKNSMQAIKIILSGDKAWWLNRQFTTTVARWVIAYFTKLRFYAILDGIKMTLLTLGWLLMNGLAKLHFNRKNWWSTCDALDQHYFLWKKTAIFGLNQLNLAIRKDRVGQHRNGQTTYFASDILTIWINYNVVILTWLIFGVQITTVIFHV